MRATNPKAKTENQINARSSWEDRNRQLFEATEIEKKITFFTLLLIILVASFNLCSSVMQISSQKIRDLAIFSSIGMKKNNIKLILIDELIIYVP